MDRAGLHDRKFGQPLRRPTLKLWGSIQYLLHGTGGRSIAYDIPVAELIGSRLLVGEVDERILKICFDTGHHSYAGFDPVAFMKRHIGRISYMHFKDIDPKVKAEAIANRTGFYDACGQGIFCNLGKGDVDFPAVRQVLLDAGFEFAHPQVEDTLRYLLAPRSAAR